MASSDRPELGDFLKEKTGIRYAYFNPSSSVYMKYPCIVYQRDKIDSRYADNNVYGTNYRYSLTLIDQNPDSKYLDKVANLPQCRHERHYIADDLSHDVFTIYFK